jgi:hypothetical protein
MTQSFPWLWANGKSSDLGVFPLLFSKATGSTMPNSPFEGGYKPSIHMAIWLVYDIVLLTSDGFG